ncbi:NADH-quinone oxidoreductase subunit N [Actinotalea ferrariae CF5-4]|uniref:NADH-quinone oxidoreductase subunit N n=1 Tax=Actinotalea ferrariae CF5-4 TaxID=948458 RepID=A0A021VTM0_9CELL|nr:proton-conducting transporter membrane subunit [Actinotalea ferrariae]EYR64506.1 NADH-quinone oxidoreductase subunit N [Actinotalea ferrariae CF5-4]
MSGSPTDLLPELLLVLGAAVGLLLGLWTPQHRQGRVRLVALTAALASAAAAVPALLGDDVTVYGGTWVIDEVTGVVRLTVALSTAAVLALSSRSLAGHPRETEAYVLMLLGATGAVALAAAGDMLMLVAAYLVASVPLYALAGFVKDSRGTEATLKYYLMGAFAGVLMLVGLTTLVLATGGSGYAGLTDRLPGAPTSLVAVGAIGLLAGVGFKAGAVPMHFWVPDVIAGTTPAMAAFITTVPKLGAVAAAFRLLEGPLAEPGVDVALVVAVIAALSMTWGNLAAFQQTEVLRLMAYSTVSQVGYLFMAVAVAARTDLAEPALALYLAGYAVTNVGAFAAAAALPQARTLTDWARAARRRPWLVGSLVVVLLGLVGTPPTAVFVGKVTVFAAAADGSFGWLMVLAAVNTVASLFYYLRWFGPAVRMTARPAGTGPAADVLPAPARTAYAAAVGSLLLGAGAGLWLLLVGL